MLRPGRSTSTAVAAVFALIVSGACGDPTPAAERTTTPRSNSPSSKPSLPATTDQAPASTASASTPEFSTSQSPATTVLASTTHPSDRLAPFTGLGIWIDMFEWSPTVTDGSPSFGADDIATLRTWGVETIYIQSGRQRGAEDVLDPATFKAIVDTSHAVNIDVVSWYLPQHIDEAKDLERVAAPMNFGVDGIIVDIESKDFEDVAERNARAKRLGERLRSRIGPLPLGAAVFSPVALARHEPDTWPGFDWTGILAPFDAVFPMAYWTIYQNESPSSGDAYRYTKETLEQVRALVPGIPIHNVGGVLYEEEQYLIPEMVRGMTGQELVGVSLYSWKNSRLEHFEPLLPYQRKTE